VGRLALLPAVTLACVGAGRQGHWALAPGLPSAAAVRFCAPWPDRRMHPTDWHLLSVGLWLLCPRARSSLASGIPPTIRLFERASASGRSRGRASWTIMQATGKRRSELLSKKDETELELASDAPDVIAGLGLNRARCCISLALLTTLRPLQIA
jgi:hypothetical protein